MGRRFMKCTKCGSTNLTVRKSVYKEWDNETKPYTYRRRLCLSCSNRFSTREYTIPDLIAFGKQGYLEMIDDLTPN